MGKGARDGDGRAILCSKTAGGFILFLGILASDSTYLEAEVPSPVNDINMSFISEPENQTVIGDQLFFAVTLDAKV